MTKCEICGKEFRTFPSYIKKKRGLCCSIECRNKINTGKKRTLETKEKMRNARLGKKCSEETRKKMSIRNLENPIRYWLGKKRPSPSKETRLKMSISRRKTGNRFPIRRGALNNKWKGGITSEDRKQRVKFRDIMQKNVFERDEYKCQDCGKGGYLQVHHIKEWSEYPELRFEMDNCKTLCMKCHYKITFNKDLKDGMIWGHNLSKIKNI